MKPSKNRNKPTQDQIAIIAYQLWENGGHQSGRDLHYWLLAEKQLSASSLPARSETMSREPSRKDLSDIQSKRSTTPQRAGNGQPLREVVRS